MSLHAERVSLPVARAHAFALSVREAAGKDDRPRAWLFDRSDRVQWFGLAGVGAFACAWFAIAMAVHTWHLSIAGVWAIGALVSLAAHFGLVRKRLHVKQSLLKAGRERAGACDDLATANASHAISPPATRPLADRQRLREQGFAAAGLPRWAVARTTALFAVALIALGLLLKATQILHTLFGAMTLTAVAAITLAVLLVVDRRHGNLSGRRFLVRLAQVACFALAAISVALVDPEAGQFPLIFWGLAPLTLLLYLGIGVFVEASERTPIAPANRAS